jgi:hypothetical protein
VAGCSLVAVVPEELYVSILSTTAMNAALSAHSLLDYKRRNNECQTFHQIGQALF